MRRDTSKVTGTARLALSLLLVGLLTGGSGCDRGSHPDQLDRPAPAIAVSDGQHAVDLHDLRGQVVVLNFWASWCAPCLAEMPSLEALQGQLPQIKVIGVAFDEDAATYQAYLARHPVAFLSVLDTTGTAHASFGTFRPPETYVIDKAGVIRRKFIGAQDWTGPEIIAALRKLAQG